MVELSENEFLLRLKKAQDLMMEEKYDEALVELYKLRTIEKAGDFDYSLTHKLYQLISNSESLHNQKRLISHVEEVAKTRESISIDELHKLVSEKGDLNLSQAILQRELELLILRAIIPYKIVGNELFF